jgi:HEAT repeat protein
MTQTRGTLFLAACLALSGWIRVAAAGAAAELLGKITNRDPSPGASPEVWRETIEALTKAGPEAVRELAGMLRDPAAGGKESDVKARYALHGMALRVTRPGAGAERRMFSEAIAARLAEGDPPAVRAFLIQQLQIAGDAAAVEALGRFLADEGLCDDAAQALLAIREGASPLFRRALPAASGGSRVTICQALGILRDREAVPSLLAAAADKDREVRLAALFALGNIGDERAADALRKAAEAEGLYERAKAVDALLLLAQRLAEGGKQDAAGRIYRELWEKPAEAAGAHARCAALRGLAGVLGPGAVPLLLEAMRSDDPVICGVAMDLAARAPGQDLTRRWIQELKNQEAAVRAGVLAILARRGDPAARADVLLALKDVLLALKDGDASVRRAAIDAAADLGGGEAVAALAGMLGGADGAEREAARRALVRMRSDSTEKAVAEALAGAPAAVRAALIGVLTARRAADQLGKALEYAGDPDESVRVAVLDALGVLGGPKALPKIVDLLVAAKGAGELRAAEKAALAVCAAAPNRAECSDCVLAALPKAETQARCALLRALGRLGGDKALEALRAGVKDPRPEIVDAAARILADWPTAAVAPDLLAIAEGAKETVHRILALRGYARVAGLLADKPDVQCRIYRKAMELATRPEDKKLVFSGLANVAHLEALGIAEQYIGDEALGSEAAAATVRIAAGLGGAHPEAAKESLRKVIRVSKDANLLARAKELLDNLEKEEGYVRSWVFSGPYAQPGKSCTELFDVAFPPEQEQARDVVWRLWSGDEKQAKVIDLKALLGAENSVAYLRAQLWSPEPCKARLEVGSDDGVKVWLNGKVVHAANVTRGLTDGRDKVSVSLEKGWNRLLLKVTQATASWAACVRVLAAEGGRAEGLRTKAE